MINVEDLLKPIADGQPCGPDLGYDPAYDELQTLLKGKPEVEIGTIKKPAEPPDWKQLHEKSVDFLRRSKDLRVVVILCGSALKTGGLEGFGDGLALTKGMVEQYWDTLHPQLDPDDKDPTQRLNILRSLTSARGSVDSWLRLVDYLYAAPVCRPQGMPPITFEQIEGAKLRESGSASAPADAPDPGKLATAIQAAGTEQLTKAQEQVKAAIESAKALDQFLTTTLGAGNTISFEVLHKTLQDISNALQGYLTGEPVAGNEGAEGGAAEAGVPAGAGVGIKISGAIRTRNDVVRALDTICAYYAQAEPSSPVPLLLKRARLLAKMGFVEAMQELNLATIDSLKTIGGSAVEQPPEPAPAEPAS